MINKINLGFGNERSFLKKEKIIKIYNKGNIIVSRPKSSKNNYQILSIKRCVSPQKKKLKKAKSIKKKSNKMRIDIEEMVNEEDKTNNVGYILRNSFSKEELENIIEFGPSPIRNRILLNNKKEKEKDKNQTKIKPYVPLIKYNEPKEINERYLKRTINIFKENEFIINKVNEILKNSNFINEEKIKIEKEKELKRINDERNKIKKFIENKRKEKENKDKIILFEELENFNGDNLNKGNMEEKIDNKNENKKENIMNKEKFIEIIDIKKDLKYIEAEKMLKSTKEDCEKLEDFVLEIDQTIKQNKNRANREENSTKKNIEITSIDKAKQLISEIKDNIDMNNFDINKLNKEDKKLLKGAERYNPNKRKKIVKNKIIDKNKETILVSSINSLKELKKTNNNMKEEFQKKDRLNKKEKEISKEWKNNNECAKAYLNNIKKGEKININRIRDEKNIILENKIDIYNYIYMPKEYEKHWYNNKDTKDKTEYKHPFLIYDD